MRLIFTDSLIIKKTRSTQLSVAIFTVSVFICTKGVVVVASFAQLTCSLASKRSMRFENICISFDTSIIAFKITQIYSMCVDAKLSQTKVRHSAFTLQHRQTPISVTHFSIWLDSIAIEVFSIYRNTLTFFFLSLPSKLFFFRTPRIKYFCESIGRRIQFETCFQLHEKFISTDIYFYISNIIQVQQTCLSR